MFSDSLVSLLAPSLGRVRYKRFKRYYYQNKDTEKYKETHRKTNARYRELHKNTEEFKEQHRIARIKYYNKKYPIKNLCECGAMVSIWHENKHRKTQRHSKRLMRLENQLKEIQMCDRFTDDCSCYLKFDD